MVLQRWKVILLGLVEAWLGVSLLMDPGERYRALAILTGLWLTFIAADAFAGAVFGHSLGYHEAEDERDDA